MGLPTTASVSTVVDVPAGRIFDLIADIERMGEWSPECRSCTWLGEPGQVGSRFRGSNRNGLARWTTTAEVLVADRPAEFTFATIYRDAPSTRWSYRLEGDGPTTLTESFESIHTPALIGLVERIFIRNRQEQIESGMARTIAAIKAAAEAP